MQYVRSLEFPSNKIQLKENITQAGKLDFEATSNVAKNESFLLGLQLAKTLNVKNLSVFADLELIVKHVRKLL